jgi:hypothetical protein
MSSGAVVTSSNWVSKPGQTPLCLVGSRNTALFELSAHCLSVTCPLTAIHAAIHEVDYHAVP